MENIITIIITFVIITFIVITVYSFWFVCFIWWDGRYSREQIGDAFGTAYTGFYAAKLETLESNPNHR